MLDRVVGWLGYARADECRAAAAPAEPGAQQWLYALGDAWRYGVPDASGAEAQAGFYQRLSWVQIAVQALAQVAAGTNLMVKRRRPGEHLEDIAAHPFEVLLQHPNPYHSRFEFLEATFAYRALTGNAYWFLNRLDAQQVPLELWVIPPHMIQPVPDGHSYIRGYLFCSGTGAEIALEPWEVVHFKRFNPLNPFVGLSPLEALRYTASGDLKMQEWNRNFFAQDNAKLPGALAFADPINDTDWERIKADLKREHGGAERRLMLLRNAGQGGVQWIPMGLNQTDMQFLAGRQFTKEEIFAVFAPGLASVLDVNATEANARSGRASFLDFAVWPALCAVAEKITRNVLPAYALQEQPAPQGAAPAGASLVGVFEDIRVTERELRTREREGDFRERELRLAEIGTYAQFHSREEVRERYYG
jgi:HK97 family phage portal protein